MPQHWHPLNVFFLALQLLAVPSQAQGSCSCDPTTTMATGNASNTTTMGATMTTLAPVSNATTLAPVSNATTLAPVSDATTPAPAPTPATTTTTTPSGGPSAGPARLLEEMWSGRVLQSSNATTTASAAAGSSNATTTTVMTAAATTVAECPPCVVTPLVVSTFTSTLALTSASDLGAIDFDAMKGALVTDQGWDTAADVTVQVVVKVAVQYSFSAAITPLQCQTAVAIANGLDVDKVTCVGGAA